MVNHTEINDTQLRSKIRSGKIRYGGNRRLKIYGQLNCKSGKRMKPESRIFFSSIKEAENKGYRPCGHCMPDEYRLWKQFETVDLKMNLFDNPFDEKRNLLPQDGLVNYYGKLFTKAEAEHFYEQLMKTIVWKNDEAIIFGKHILTKRKVAWYGEKPFEYTYSNTTKQALPWTAELLQLKKIIEHKTGETFNSCLLNLYHNGSEGMAWHSDGEKDLKKNGAIGSLSFGAERRFSFKHKETKEKVTILLENGSLLVMKGVTQTHWLHRLPPTKTIQTPRINLTFRTITEII